VPTRTKEALIKSALFPQGLEAVMNFPAGVVAGENRARRGGGRRLWLFQGQDDNKVWRGFYRNP